ncbi:acylase [Caldimonas brevitalea]|uniref:Aculeacin A acylase n=1 Tax=Caldimonas brevitalea TaxID=413882 RepID=A0A0G3BNG5_9BURK|nr:acylase [Caldimonas brevitalea]AKJ30942.1 aculeacin A acylase [Caldimonas brevitalea]
MAAATLVGCGGLSSTPSAPNGYAVEVRRTTHGVPHVKADDYASLGYGLGYAYAQDNLCLLADQIVTVRGERSRHFGPDASTTVAFRPLKNLDSDFYFRLTMDDAGLAAGFARSSAEAQALLRGYAAGYNRYLRDTPEAQRPAACRGAEWVRPMTLADLLRLNEEKATQAGAGTFALAIASASPPQPGAKPTTALPRLDLAALDTVSSVLAPPIGSNGWAFGKATSANGRGLLLANPHFPWGTTNRFYQVHLTVPGQLDVMGASLGQLPLVTIGFNRDVAWTHTVSTARRFTLHALQLVPGHPTRYVVDGAVREMQERLVSVEVRGPDGTLSTQTRRFHTTEYGPTLVMPAAGLLWTAQHAYAVADANRLNTRMLDTWLAINRARSVAEVRAGLGNLGIPWVNTVAADRHGAVLYADISAAPNVSETHMRRCAPPEAAKLFQSAKLVLLDGARRECAWRVDPASPVPGLFAPAEMPATERDDYVANSNDSYWLTHAAQPLSGLAPILGPTGVPQGLRTRMGLMEIGRQLRSGDGHAPGRVDDRQLQDMVLSNRSLAAELVLDDLLAVASEAADAEVRSAAAVLARWDRRHDANSRGAPLFKEWWSRVRTLPSLYRVPFDAADPVHTPRGLALTEPARRDQLLGALREAHAAMLAAGFAPDAPLGEMQAALTHGGRIPVHGGDDHEGVLNSVATTRLSRSGYQPVYGTSYLQTVRFDTSGPIAHGLLVYGQTTDPSAATTNQALTLFAEKQWPRLPFTDAAINAESLSSRLFLRE